MNNSRYSNGAVRSTPAWQPVMFAIIGSIGFLLVLAVGDFAVKHAHTHQSYREWIWLGLMVFGVAAIAFFWRTLTQMWPSTIAMVKSLKWYHWLWLATLVSGLVFRKRTASEGVNTPVDSAAVFRIGIMGSVGMVILCQMFLRKVEWLRSVFTGIIGLLIWFDLMALLSTMWSVYWQWTLYKSIEYGVDVCLLAVIVYVVRSTEEFELFFNWTWVLYAGLLVNVWLGCVWDPNDALLKGGIYGVQGIGGLGVWLQGVFPDLSSNQLAEYAACIAAVALCRLLPLNRKREKTAWYLTVFVFGFVTMIFGQTRSAVGGFCIAVFLIYLLSSRVGQGATIVISSVMMMIVSGFGQYIFDYLKRGQSANQLDSFSNRLEWWEVALDKFAMYPLTGLGMWAAARFGVLAKIGYSQTATIHSDWVEIIVGTGAWGLIPVLLLMATAWYVLIRCTINKRLAIKDRQLAYEAMAAFAVVSARMFFMTDLSLHPPCHFLICLGAAEFLRRKLRGAYASDEAPAQLAAVAGV